MLDSQFIGPSAWEKYFSALEAATPVIEAVLTREYYVTDTYENVGRRSRKEGRLPRVELTSSNLKPPCRHVDADADSGARLCVADHPIDARTGFDCAGKS